MVALDGMLPAAENGNWKIETGKWKMENRDWGCESKGLRSQFPCHSERSEEST
jgi:hypothetical protein